MQPIKAASSTQRPDRPGISPEFPVHERCLHNLATTNGVNIAKSCRRVNDLPASPGKFINEPSSLRSFTRWVPPN